MGNLSDQFGRADYNEWGQITYKDALDITSSYRRIWPQLSYTGHDWDDVLGMYYAKARFYSADDKRFVAMDPIKGNITNPLSLVPYVYCVDNPLRWVDPLGLMGKDLLNNISEAYRWGIISDDNLALVVILANLAKASETLWDSVVNFLMTSPFLIISDFFYSDEEDDLFEDDIPENRGIYTLFHEIAQVVAAKQIKESDDALLKWGYPELERLVQINNKEIDIAWGNYIWEVKPSYHGYNSWTKSLKKYIPNYNSMKKIEDYSILAQLLGPLPGWEFETKRIKLFKQDDVQYLIGVESKGFGRVGYFFEFVCSDDDDTELRADDMANKLRALFKVASTIKDVRNLGPLIGLALAALITVIPADDAIAVGAAETAVSNVVNFISESGVEGAVEAAEILWDLFAA